MPGPAIHHIIAERYLQDVLQVKYNDRRSAAFWAKMSGPAMQPVYLLGAQGPDFLFFNMNDWPQGGAVKTVAQVYWEVNDFLEDLVEKVKSLIPPELWQAIDTLEALADTAVERSATLSEIAALAGDVQKNIDAIKLVIETKIEEYVTDSADLFNLIKHPQHHGQDFPEWWWFDTLHLRRSGRFVSRLLKDSSHGTLQRAYALGYMTHYAADAVGHPFVNIVAGGPYRTHAQRHKVSENHQDVWAYAQYKKGELITSDLAAQYVVNGNPKKLPRALTSFIISTIRRVYYEGDAPLYGKDITEEDLNVAYRTWLGWFRGATNDAGLPLPQPYSLTAEIAEAWEKFVDNVGDIADLVGQGLSGGGGLLGFLQALAALIAGPILLAAALVDFLAGEVTTLAAAPMRFFLSLTYQALYDAYQNLRKGLVVNGFTFPKISDLNDPFTRHMLDTGVADKFGHNASSLRGAGAYPASKFKMAGLDNESHLVYPWPTLSSGEPDPCVGAANPYYAARASWYIDDPKNAFDSDQYEYFRAFAEAGTSGVSEAAVKSKFSEFAKRARLGGLGNAMAFSDALYGEFLRKGADTQFIDLNLDSDRGYAFKSWRKVVDSSFLNSPINDVAKVNVAIEDDKQVPDVQDDILYPDWSVR